MDTYISNWVVFSALILATDPFFPLRFYKTFLNTFLDPLKPALQLAFRGSIATFFGLFGGLLQLFSGYLGVYCNFFRVIATMYKRLQLI